MPAHGGRGAHPRSHVLPGGRAHAGSALHSPGPYGAFAAHEPPRRRRRRSRHRPPPTAPPDVREHRSRCRSVKAGDQRTPRDQLREQSADLLRSGGWEVRQELRPEVVSADRSAGSGKGRAHRVGVPQCHFYRAGSPFLCLGLVRNDHPVASDHQRAIRDHGEPRQHLRAALQVRNKGRQPLCRGAGNGPVLRAPVRPRLRAEGGRAPLRRTDRTVWLGFPSGGDSGPPRWLLAGSRVVRSSGLRRDR